MLARVANDSRVQGHLTNKQKLVPSTVHAAPLNRHNLRQDYKYVLHENFSLLIIAEFCVNNLNAIHLSELLMSLTNSRAAKTIDSDEESSSFWR